MASISSSTRLSRDTAAINVEVTMMNNSLQIHTEKGGFELQLNTNQASALRQELRGFYGYRTDSHERPIILGAVCGGTTPSSKCARSASESGERDCQVSGLNMLLSGARLIFELAGRPAFIQLDQVQLKQAQDELAVLLA